MIQDGVSRGAYYSKFGGLWIDDLNPKNVEDRIERIADADLRQKVRNFVRDGYVVMPGEVSGKTIDAYLQEYESAADTPDLLIVHEPTEWRGSFSREKARKPGARVCDTVMLLPTDPDLSFSPQIGRFLEEVFEDKALAFQSLHFEVGSTQGIHQDTAYVVVDHEPTKLIASWIALEDIEPGSGELIYYVGGHRMTEYIYSDGASKHFDPLRDGPLPHTAHLNYLHEEAARLSLPIAKFSAKKGDVLLWHAELPHGGGEITKPGRTRRSLVTHYCPKALVPHNWPFIPEEWRRNTEVRGGHAFTSLYFPPPELSARWAPVSSSASLESVTASVAFAYWASIAGKLRQKATEADARAEDAGIKVSALEVKIAHLELDIERHEQEAAALLNSTSWRLSAPWRSYRRMVSRVHRLLRGKKMNPLFDREWYLQQYADVRAGEMDPYEHYLRHGAAEGRDPNPLFDTDWYLQQNPSVRQSGENPLTHFYSVGAKEGREPIPLFDVTFYLEQNPDVLADGINPLLHYILHGAQEGRNPHSLFDTKRYLAENPDVATSGINPLVHYVLRGSRNFQPARPRTVATL